MDKEEERPHGAIRGGPEKRNPGVTPPASSAYANSTSLLTAVAPLARIPEFHQQLPARSVQVASRRSLAGGSKGRGSLLRWRAPTE